MLRLIAAIIVESRPKEVRFDLLVINVLLIDSKRSVLYLLVDARKPFFSLEEWLHKILRALLIPDLLSFIQPS